MHTIHMMNKSNVSSTWNTANLMKMNTGMRTRELKSKKLKKWQTNMRQQPGTARNENEGCHK